MKKIKSWYFLQKKGTDVIVSASPHFLLENIAKKLCVKLIVSNVDKKTGKWYSHNCYGKEKVSRFFLKFPNDKIGCFYSDSVSDAPLAKIAANPYIY